MDSKPETFFQRHYYLFRRLHSLSGIVPIGVFLIAHLLTNSSLAWGKAGLRGEMPELGVQQGGVAYFQKEVTWINDQVPHLVLVEITLWAALAFHSILGVVYAVSGKPNTARYAYQGNWRYTLQRISGYIGIAFIFYHVATLRWGWSWLVPGGTTWSAHYAASTLAECLKGGPSFTAAGVVVSLFYFAGITLLVFHFANGLWTAAITWGLTITARAQKQWGYACAGVGAALMLAAWSGLFAAMALDPAAAKVTETKLLQKSAGVETAK